MPSTQLAELSSEFIHPTSVTSSGGVARVAVVSDFVEEKWPSMDLVSDMLVENLRRRSDGAFAERIRPPFQARFTRFANHPFAVNGDRLLNRFYDYPRRLRRMREEFDLFHIVDHSYSQVIHELPAERTVVTCHDLDTFRCVLEPDVEPRPLWFRHMVQKILSGFTKAARVIAVSSATEKELLRFRLVSPERITVIPNGVHPSCSPVPQTGVDEYARELLGAGQNTVQLLSVSSTHPRKRLDLLLRIFASVQAKAPEVRLVRVGGGFTPEQARLARELSIVEKIHVLPFLERDVLAAVYRQAALLLHTAEAEGFGLPLVEALACGCPVVASSLSVLKEVCGSAASYCPVGDIASWTKTVLSLLEARQTEPLVWERRRLNGIDHAASFSWTENARKTADVYRAVLNAQA